MSKGYHHLTRDSRCQLYALKKRGDSETQVSKELGAHRSTIYRELMWLLVGNTHTFFAIIVLTK